MTILERVINSIVFCKKDDGLKPEDILPESSLKDDLGMDSLDTLMLVSELEDEFDISIDDDSFSDVERVSDIVLKLENR